MLATYLKLLRYKSISRLFTVLILLTVIMVFVELFIPTTIIFLLFLLLGNIIIKHKIWMLENKLREERWNDTDRLRRHLIKTM